MSPVANTELFAEAEKYAKGEVSAQTVRRLYDSGNPEQLLAVQVFYEDFMPRTNGSDYSRLFNEVIFLQKMISPAWRKIFERSLAEQPTA